MIEGISNIEVIVTILFIPVLFGLLFYFEKVENSKVDLSYVAIVKVINLTNPNWKEVLVLIKSYGNGKNFLKKLENKVYAGAFNGDMSGLLEHRKDMLAYFENKAEK